MLEPFTNQVRSLIDYTWPMIIISVVIIVSLRATYLITNKRKVVFHKELLLFLFIIYVMCLFQVVTFQDVSWSSNNFIPFKEIGRYTVGTRLFYKNVIGNMVLFMPYGFFASYFIKTKRPYLTIFLVLIASFAIETTQLIIGRVFDIDDIILNLIGGTIGYYLYYLLDKFKKKLPSFLKTDVLLSIIIMVMTIFVMWFLWR